MVETGGSQLGAIGGVGELDNFTGVSSQDGRASSGCVPDPHRFVFAPGCEGMAVGRPGGVGDIVGMPGKESPRFASKVPYPDGSIVRTGELRLRIGQEF